VILNAWTASTEYISPLPAPGFYIRLGMAKPLESLGPTCLLVIRDHICIQGRSLSGLWNRRAQSPSFLETDGTIWLPDNVLVAHAIPMSSLGSKPTDLSMCRRGSAVSRFAGPILRFTPCRMHLLPELKGRTGEKVEMVSPSPHYISRSLNFVVRTSMLGLLNRFLSRKNDAGLW